MYPCTLPEKERIKNMKQTKGENLLMKHKKGVYDGIPLQTCIAFIRKVI